jgi:DNA (cytosine-5)-methyltransferase 1
MPNLSVEPVRFTPVSFTFVDLFAGIGGFHGMLGALGGEGVMASEIDPLAREVYAQNWGLKPEGDIVDLVENHLDRVPEHTVLAGGFPCQPFSKSGHQKGMAEQRGVLFHEIVKILNVRRPAIVMLENVRNIAGPRQRATWDAVIDGLRECGYRVSSEPCTFSPHLLPPDRGGAPQVRDRVYILGTYVGTRRAKKETDVSPVVRREPWPGWDPMSWDFIKHVASKTPRAGLGKYRLSDEEQEWIDVWNDFLARMGDARLTGFPFWTSYWHDGARVDDAAPEWKQDLERKNIEFYRLHKREIRAWLRANPRLRSFPASRQKLEWQAQDSVRDLRACLLHMRPSGIRVKKPTYAPALVAMAETQAPVIGPLGRRITVGEAARLQGFPEWFDFGDQIVPKTYRQLGNAINIGAAYYVFRAHVTRDQDEIGVTEDGRELVRAVLSAPDAPLVQRPADGSSA